MSVRDYMIPEYIYQKKNIVRLILLTALFALVFINIYKPFSSSSWYQVSEFKFFLFSSLIILTGVGRCDKPYRDVFLGQAARGNDGRLCSLDTARDILHVIILYDIYFGVESGT